SDVNGQPVSLGVALGSTLPQLQSRLAAGDNIFPASKPVLLRSGQARSLNSGGAKFLRP
ncbi:hypothetical protein HA397_29450, partial [Escherichia coli]|nr:hypothetical protein [Escherichia coli]